MRAPDLIIGNPMQTLRWHLIQWRGFQLALHCWLKSDDDRALHDHSADNWSFILSPQGYYEVIGPHNPSEFEFAAIKTRRAWIPYFRKAETPHRVLLCDDRPVWTLWLRFPPRRQWGFWCPKGWRHWREYVAEREYHSPGSTSTVGRGCG